MVNNMAEYIRLSRERNAELDTYDQELKQRVDVHTAVCWARFYGECSDWDGFLEKGLNARPGSMEEVVDMGVRNLWAARALLEALKTGELRAFIDDDAVEARAWVSAESLFDFGRAYVRRDELLHLLPPGRDPEAYRTGRPGRPSQKELSLAIFARRCEAGKVCGTLEDEAGEIYGEVLLEHSQAVPAKVKTIKNHIRSRYGAWKASR